MVYLFGIWCFCSFFSGFSLMYLIYLVDCCFRLATTSIFGHLQTRTLKYFYEWKGGCKTLLITIRHYIKFIYFISFHLGGRGDSSCLISAVIICVVVVDLVIIYHHHHHHQYYYCSCCYCDFLFSSSCCRHWLNSCYHSIIVLF